MAFYGAGLSLFPYSVDTHGIVYDHTGLPSRPHGSPLYLKTGNYESGSYDIRPTLLAYWTDRPVAPYAWSIAQTSLGVDLQIANSDPSVLAVESMLTGPSLVRLFRFDGLKTGRTELTMTLTEDGVPVLTLEPVVVHVVGDSQFTDAQLAVLEAGGKARQKWSIRLNDASEDLVVIHDETDHNGLRSVTDKGSRRNKIVNIAPSVRKKLSSAAYTITCSNVSNRFSTEASDSFFTGVSGSYEPNECNLIHQVYLLVDGAWEELEFLTYEGQILDMRFNVEKEDVDIETEELAGRFILRTLFSESHGDYNDTTAGLNTEWNP